MSKARELSADPTYTISPDLLTECLAFLAKYYTFVSLQDVLAARTGVRPLPACPLLITFDDGWQDNLDHALPVFQRAGVPWVLFAARDAVTSPEIWWHEILQWAVRSGATTREELWRMAAGDEAMKADDLALLLRFGTMPEELRRKALSTFDAGIQGAYGGHNVMLNAEGLRVLRDHDVAIGAHGGSHLPLTAVSEVGVELVEVRDWLVSQVGPTSSSAISFPHGRYDAGIVGAARLAGYKLLFTSDAILNGCPGGWLPNDLLGRISVTMGSVADDRGRLERERLATWLIMRTRKVMIV